MTDRQVCLSQLCDVNRSICYGIVQPGKPLSAGIPIVRVNNFERGRLTLDDAMIVDPDIERKFKRSRPRQDDVLISLVGSIGQVAIAPPELEGWNIARAVGLIPINDAHTARWIYYNLLTEDAQRYIFSRANTTVQATFNLRDLAELVIPYPPRRERESVIHVLATLDDKIELNRRMNETLEQMAQAIFKDWFVDFGPVRRKQQGVTDPVAIMGGLVQDVPRAAELAALFPDDSGNDGLPEGWTWGTLDQLANATGNTVDPATLDPATPYIGLEHMPRKSIMLDSWGASGSVSSNKTRFEAGQTLFGKLRPYFHKVGIAAVDGVSSTDIVILDAKRRADRPFVTCCVSSDEFVAFSDKGSDGTKMPRTSWPKMKEFVIAVAPKNVRNAFEGVALPMHEKIVASVAENRTLAETRDYLLPKLMSGEVRVREAEVEMMAVESL